MVMAKRNGKKPYRESEETQTRRKMLLSKPVASANNEACRSLSSALYDLLRRGPESLRDPRMKSQRILERPHRLKAWYHHQAKPLVYLSTTNRPSDVAYQPVHRPYLTHQRP
jgi:hypothetical protein